jgi:hypothetical protein
MLPCTSRTPLLSGPGRYELEARLKNGQARTMNPVSRRSREARRRIPQKNDFAINDFVKPPPALIEMPLQEPRLN